MLVGLAVNFHQSTHLLTCVATCTGNTSRHYRLQTYRKCKASRAESWNFCFEGGGGEGLVRAVVTHFL